VSGQQRLTFGIPQLADGIDVIVVAVGLFALGEALWVAAHLRRSAAWIIPTGRARMGREDWARSWKPWLRGTAIGFPFGAIPAGGAELPTFLSYVTEKKLTKHPEEFGKGAIEGVAGPEATNNASAAAGLVPLLTLGLPVSATAAVLLAAFQQYGIQPGPQLLRNEPDLVWGLLASLLIGNAILLVLNLPLAPVWAKLLHIPRPYLYAGILFFACLGAYAVNGSTVDLVLLFLIGVLGFVMRRYGLPVVPAIIGVILGPRAEVHLRRALQISDGDIRGLFNSPFSVTVYTLIALVVLWPLVNRFVVRPLRRRRKPDAGSPATSVAPSPARTGAGSAAADPGPTEERAEPGSAGERIRSVPGARSGEDGDFAANPRTDNGVSQPSQTDARQQEKQ